MFVNYFLYLCKFGLIYRPRRNILYNKLIVTKENTIMANFLSKLFGTKSDRDLKEVKPFLDATLKATWIFSPSQ